MYGFSRQVTYATRLGILTNDEGHRLLSDLERELNQLYTDVYEETQEKRDWQGGLSFAKQSKETAFARL